MVYYSTFWGQKCKNLKKVCLTVFWLQFILTQSIYGQTLVRSFSTLEWLFMTTGPLFLEFCSYKNICGFLNWHQNPCDTSLTSPTVEVDSTYCVPLACCSKDCILSAKNAYKGLQFGISWYRYKEIPSTFRVCGLGESISRVQSCKLYSKNSTWQAPLGWPRNKVRISHFLYCKVPTLNLRYGFTLQCIVPDNFHTHWHQRDFL